MKRKPVVHKLVSNWGPWTQCGLLVSGLFHRMPITRKTWRGITCKNCLRAKPPPPSFRG